MQQLGYAELQIACDKVDLSFIHLLQKVFNRQGRYSANCFPTCCRNRLPNSGRSLQADTLMRKKHRWAS